MLTTDDLLAACQTIRPGEFKVIRVDGKIELHESNPRLSGIRKLLGADCLDTVIITHDLGRPVIVMMVDDTGMIDHKPVNQYATALYHSVCKPGTIHAIHGDVALVHDEDFS